MVKEMLLLELAYEATYDLHKEQEFKEYLIM
jgi:hypothetical protein